MERVKGILLKELNIVFFWVIDLGITTSTNTNVGIIIDNMTTNILNRATHSTA